jgi:hypothetical protein
MFKRLSLTQRLLAGTAFAVTLAFGTLLAITVQQSRQGAVEQAELGMRTQLDLVVTMLDYAQEALKTRARDQLTLLEHDLPGKASVGAPVDTGKLKLPRLRFGEIEGNNNPEFLEAYRKRNGVDAAFLVREGDSLYRASTLLKDADGNTGSARRSRTPTPPRYCAARPTPAPWSAAGASTCWAPSRCWTPTAR